MREWWLRGPLFSIISYKVSKQTKDCTCVISMKARFWALNSNRVGVGWGCGYGCGSGFDRGHFLLNGV